MILFGLYILIILHHIACFDNFNKGDSKKNVFSFQIVGDMITVTNNIDCCGEINLCYLPALHNTCSTSSVCFTCISALQQ